MIEPAAGPAERARDHGGERAMAKYLRVTMPDDSQWDVPAHLIAVSRAHHYADREPAGPERSKVYLEELNLTLNDSEELADWAANNMNWEDVASSATLAVPPPDAVDFQEGWCNGDKEVIDR